MRTEDVLTTVSVSWRKNKRNHRLLFGTPRRWVRLDWRRRLAVFETGQIFGYERWAAGRHGTIHWSVHVLQAGGAGEQLTSVTGVRPGARILLTGYGKDRARRALSEFEKLGEPTVLERIDAEQWHVLGGRLAAGFPIWVRGVSK